MMGMRRSLLLRSAAGAALVAAYLSRPSTTLGLRFLARTRILWQTSQPAHDKWDALGLGAEMGQWGVHSEHLRPSSMCVISFLWA